jgi:curli production assembly/transport component CsgG
VPIERENIGNLLQERNLFVLQDKNIQKMLILMSLKLLYAGILLEGGIVSYDSNIMGGFGLGILVQGSYQIQTGQGNHLPTMVSTSNGKILKSVYISKTILSQAIDQSLFKYVSFKRLLEVETGYTTNEPVQILQRQ